MEQSDTYNGDFDPRFYGDEAIMDKDEDGKLHIRIKIQMDRDEYRTMKFTFDTQTQVERLLPVLVKAMVNARTR